MIYLTDIKKYLDTMEAKKEEEGKISYSDIPYESIESLAKVFNTSKLSGKYERDNHIKSLKNTTLHDSIQRHLNALMKGEDIDESGNSHYAHIMANAAILEYLRINNLLIENRIYVKI